MQCAALKLSNSIRSVCKLKTDYTTKTSLTPVTRVWSIFAFGQRRCAIGQFMGRITINDRRVYYQHHRSVTVFHNSMILALTLTLFLKLVFHQSVIVITSSIYHTCSSWSNARRLTKRSTFGQTHCAFNQSHCTYEQMARS